MARGVEERVQWWGDAALDAFEDPLCLRITALQF